MKNFPKGQCSVLVKALPGYENVFASHSTYDILTYIHCYSMFHLYIHVLSWYIYSSMLRTYKHYSFQLADERAGTWGGQSCIHFLSLQVILIFWWFYYFQRVRQWASPVTQATYVHWMTSISWIGTNVYIPSITVHQCLCVNVSLYT